jgi:uncharacterized protein
MTDLDAALLVAAWLTGLAGGGGHCLAMCGGIVGALGLRQRRGWRGLTVLLSAHLGRMLSYATVGAVTGFLGAAVFASALGPRGMAALRIAAAVLVTLIGLQLLLGRPLLASAEKLGARLWRWIAPSFRGLLPPRDPLRGLAVGALWGWLPCGLVYTELSVAAASGGATEGALVMLAFGAGTSVSLSVAGALLQWLGIGRLSSRLSGALLVLFGVWMALPFLGGPAMPAMHAHALTP